MIANPGDVDIVALETLRNIAENVLNQPNQTNNNDDPKPNSSKINVISDILIKPPNQLVLNIQTQTKQLILVSKF